MQKTVFVTVRRWCEIIQGVPEKCIRKYLVQNPKLTSTKFFLSYTRSHKVAHRISKVLLLGSQKSDRNMDEVIFFDVGDLI